VAGFGVWFGAEHPMNAGLPLPAGMRRTNNVAEIYAATHAIRAAKVMCGVVNHSTRRGVSNLLASIYSNLLPAFTPFPSLPQDLGLARLRVCTDSQFLINCVQDWMRGWKRNGWKTAKGEPGEREDEGNLIRKGPKMRASPLFAVINRPELEALDGLLASGDLVVDWRHVPGHAGVPGNEAADELARRGADADRRKESSRYSAYE